MVEKKMAWDEIKKLYDQEWVELIDYDWPEVSSCPVSGIVRVHAKTRANFDDLADIDPPYDSAYIFVGEQKKSDEVVVVRGYSRVVPEPKNA